MVVTNSLFLIELKVICAITNLLVVILWSMLCQFLSRFGNVGFRVLVLSLWLVGLWWVLEINDCLLGFSFAFVD